MSRETGLDAGIIREVKEALEGISSEDLEDWFRSLDEEQADELVGSILLATAIDVGHLADPLLPAVEVKPATSTTTILRPVSTTADTRATATTTTAPETATTRKSG